MKYNEMRELKQLIISELPFIFAFSMEQLDESLADRGMTREDLKTNNLVSFGAGCYCLQSDFKHISKTLQETNKNMAEAMESYDFAYEAFLAEMSNHEYLINYEGDYEVLSCFYNLEYNEDYDGFDYLDELGKSDEIKSAYRAARDEHYRLADVNGWY